MKKLVPTLALLLCFVATLMAQKPVLSGRVLNTDNEPLIGASVTVPSLKKTTITNEIGQYLIEDMPYDTFTVTFSYVGYEDAVRTTKTLRGTGKTMLNIQLQPKVYAFDELIVSATRAGETTPFSYTNIENKTIEERNLGQDVPYLLRFTPSTVVTSDAGTGIGYTGIRIRGVDPTGVNVTINGIPLNDSESQGVFWVNMPDFLSSTNNIQVQRGVGTSTNGAGAFGGSINMNTAQLNRDRYAEVNGTIGSFGTRKANLQLGSGLIKDKFVVEGRLSNIVSDGYIDRASVDLNSFFVSAAYIGKSSSLRANVFSGHEVTYQAWNGVPVQYADDENLRTYNSAGLNRPDMPHPNEVDDYMQTHYQLLYNQQLTKNVNLNLAGHYTRGKGFFELYESDEDYADFNLTPELVDEVLFIPSTDPEAIQNWIVQDGISVYTEGVLENGDSLIKATYQIDHSDLIQRRWLDNHFYGATFGLTYSSNSNRFQSILGGAVNQYLGGHYGEVIWTKNASNQDDVTRYYESDSEKTEANVYWKNSYNFKPAWTAFVDVQVRNLNYSGMGIDNDLNAINFNDKLTFFNPKAGLFWKASEQTNVYTSFAVANREPNRGDYIDAPGGVIPMHETLYDTEIGVQQSWEKAALNANLYYMNYKNQLAPTGALNDVGAGIRQNIDASYRAGIELLGLVQITKALSINANATFSQNKVGAFTEFVDNWDTWGQETVEHTNTDLAFSPNFIGAAEIAYSILQNTDNQDFTAALSLKRVGEQYLDNTSNAAAKLEAYGFADLRLTYTLRPKKVAQEVTINFITRNLTNAQFSTFGWIYRFQSAGYNPVADDPYARREGAEGQYNLTGLYPQAGRNFLLGLSVRF